MILHRAGIGLPRLHSGLPSWVPDWSAFPDVSVAEGVGGNFRTTGYEAAGESIPNVKAGSNPRALVFQGQLIDYVVAIGSVRAPSAVASDGGFPEAVEYNARVIDWLNEAQELVANLKLRPGTP